MTKNTSQKYTERIKEIILRRCDHVLLMFFFFSCNFWKSITEQGRNHRVCVCGGGDGGVTPPISIRLMSSGISIRFSRANFKKPDLQFMKSGQKDCMRKKTPAIPLFYSLCEHA